MIINRKEQKGNNQKSFKEYAMDNSYGLIPERKTGHICNLCGYFGFQKEGNFYEDFGGWVHYSCRARWVRMDKEEKRFEMVMDQRREG